METYDEFFYRNPDVPTKLRNTVIAFIAIAFVLTGASILTSLALTVVYLFVYGVILYVKRKVDGNGNISSTEPDYFMDIDTDEEDLTDYDFIVSKRNVDEEKFLRSRNQCEPSPVELDDVKNGKLTAEPSPDKPYRIGKPSYDRRFIPVARSQELMMARMEPSKTVKMNQSRHSTNRLVGFMSPEPQHVLGIGGLKLSRQPLRPTVKNTPTSSAFARYSSNKIFAMNVSKPSFQTTSIKLNGPQTSSPFHEQSPVGLWDTMSLSAIAGSPKGYLSPITSPSKENDPLYENHSSQQIFVNSPSPDKGLGLSHKHHPLHTTGNPVDSKKHIHSVNSHTSYWQRLDQKEQKTLLKAGRPKLQSPVTVRIARPRNSNVTSETRHRRRPLINQDPGDSLRKDVILSALREKRKRGKAGQEEDDRSEENSNSFQEENYEGAARQKKRRLDSSEETRRTGRQSKVRSNYRYTPAETPSEVDTRDEMEVASADNSLNQSSGKLSFHRNAIVSSLSSSKMWKDNHRKRSLQSDEQEKLPKLPPKKVTRSTDASDLEPKVTQDKEREDKKSSENGENSKEEEETSERQEHEKTVISPRLRKRGVFATLHRGKQIKPPSPEQITAADLHEDRQRARQRIQQMRMVLRDDEATVKDTTETDKPLLPAAKPAQTGVNPLSSVSSVTPASSLTEVDGKTKTLGAGPGTNSSKTLTFGESLFDKSSKGNSISFGLSGQAKKDTPTSSSGGIAVSFDLPKTTAVVAPTNTLSVSVSSPPSSSKPSSLLQALSSMQKSVAADSKRGSTLPSGGGLGLIGQSSLKENPAFSLAASSGISTNGLPSSAINGISAKGTSTTLTTSTAAPTFSFGSGSTGLQKSRDNTTIPSRTTAKPTLQFGSGSSALTTSSTGPVTQTQALTSSPFTFGSSAPPPYMSSQSLAPQTVSSFSAPVSSSSVSVQSNFMFGSTPSSTQSVSFNTGTTSSTSTTVQGTLGTFSFGATNKNAPSFSFGQPVTSSQQTGQSLSFGFTSGSATATTTPATSTVSSPALFSFGATPVSSTASSSSSGLFQTNPQTTSTTTSSGTTSLQFEFRDAKSLTTPGFGFGQTTASHFTFRDANPLATTSSDPTKVPAAFGSGQTNSSTGFSFASQQSKPASQGSLFSSSQSSSQPSGFTFGAQPQKPASQGSLFANNQTAPQTGFTFGSQSSQGTQQNPLFPSAQQNQSGSMFGSGGSASTPALNFGTQAASTPGSLFQFGGSTGATPSQQQSNSGFNFSATPSTNFSFGGGTTSVPAFGQGQQATPPRQGGGFNMGSTNAPRKGASRMRPRQRAGRR